VNRKRKILTVAALVIFGVIIGFHYACFSTHYWRGEAGGINLLGTGWYLLWGVPRDVIIEDIRMPLFVLAVFYVGLFSLLGDKKRDSQ
jgi:hypothetical protein